MSPFSDGATRSSTLACRDDRMTLFREAAADVNEETCIGASKMRRALFLGRGSGMMEASQNVLPEFAADTSRRLTKQTVSASLSSLML